MNKNESKYFNTAVKMDKALLELLEKKDFEYITIKEICALAEVNRSTFYLHYENTSDLLKETTQYITDSFLSYFSVEKQSIAYRFENSDLKDLVFITPEYLSPYLTFIKENQRVFKTSIKQFGSMDFNGVYNKMFKYIFNPILERFDFPENSRPYVLKFYLTGITAIVMEWLENDCSEEIDNIIKIIIDCVVGKSGINAQDLK
ncbi:MAG: TetR/AcrR family transcriptional regulator C-terminal domain-containing protein [Clostridia bacterium]|nr:TetR/AcrR family transcriptional regulator C-terminal domain-containing protein [Clostridia bacterium]